MQTQLFENVTCFISNKDEEFLPSVTKLFVPLVCLDIEENDKNKFILKNIWLKAIFRLILDQTSQKHNINNLLGIKTDELSKEI